MTAWFLDIWMSRTGVEERASEDRGDGRLRGRGSLHKPRPARRSTSLFSPRQRVHISPRPAPRLLSSPASFSLRRSCLTTSHATQAAPRGLFLRSDHLSPTCRRRSSSLSPANHHHTPPSDARKMYIHVPLLLFLLSNAAPSDAALFSRDSESSLSRAARHVRRHVIKRSTGLLDDLRLAYTGIRLQQQQAQQQQQVLFQSSKMYCVNNGNTGLGIANNGTSGSSAPSSSDTGISQSASSAAPSSVSSSSPTTTTSPTNAATTTPKAAATQSTSPATASPTATGSSSGSSSSPWKVAQSYVRCAFTSDYATI